SPTRVAKSACQTAPNQREFKRPAKALLWSEPWRAWADGISLLGAMQALAEAPPGDGHGVLVIPGFLTDDSSTFVLRNALRAAGYDVRAWPLGHNLGPTSWLADGAVMGLTRRYEET